MRWRRHIAGIARATVLTCVLISSAPAEDASVEGFLSDYSQLEPAKDNPFDEIYVSPSAGRGAKYTAVMVDQPEIFIHPDSPYKGMKPDDLKLIADELRESVVRELYGSYQIVEVPGPGVLMVRMAVGDLVLQKRKQPATAYTPAGTSAYAGKEALVRDVVRNVDLSNLKIEAEALDSQTHEQLGAMTASRGGLTTGSGQPGWNDVENVFSVLGKRLRCRLDNARAAQGERKNCGAIGLAAAAGPASGPLKR
ncbi:MAG: DUF3313 domain-containing protein [Gammaproteobacteria bacterium]